jgi:hypothetical protein
LVRQKHESNSEKAKGLGVLLKWYRAYIANTKLSSIPCTIKKKKKKQQQQQLGQREAVLSI